MSRAAVYFATLRQLLPYLWPEGRPGLKARVVVAMVALVLSKVVTVATPYAFKHATDALAGRTDAQPRPPWQWYSWCWPMAWAAS